MRRPRNTDGMTACVLISITVALASALAFVSYVFVLSLTSFGRDVLASIAQDAAEAVQIGLHGQAEVREPRRSFCVREMGELSFS